MKKVVKAKNLMAFRIWLENIGYSVKSLADDKGFTFSFKKEYGLVTCDLSGNNLGQLGNVEKLPTDEMILNFKEQLIQRLDIQKFKSAEVRHQVAAKLLEQGDVNGAWYWLLMKI